MFFVVAKVILGQVRPLQFIYVQWHNEGLILGSTAVQFDSRIPIKALPERRRSSRMSCPNRKTSGDRARSDFVSTVDLLALETAGRCSRVSKSICERNGERGRGRKTLPGIPPERQLQPTGYGAAFGRHLQTSASCMLELLNQLHLP